RACCALFMVIPLVVTLRTECVEELSFMNQGLVICRRAASFNKNMQRIGMSCMIEIYQCLARSKRGIEFTQVFFGIVVPSSAYLQSIN
ncbi:MAG: hypothetical protein ACI845_004070, partial [Gammaproteobacteria bacterium]